MKKGHKYGTHRVISPKGVLPQPADKLDNNMDEIYDNEILIDVQTLNIDSASFTQISNQAGGDKAKIAEIMLDIVEKQGKHRQSGNRIGRHAAGYGREDRRRARSARPTSR